MTAEEQKRYINYLAERVNASDLENRAMRLVLQDFLDEKKAFEERLSKLDSVLSDMEDLKNTLASEVKKRKYAERKVSDLTAKLKFADKNRFGDKRQKVKKAESTKAEESDRGKDEDDFDGTSAERAVRPLTTQRNSMLHFGSDEGAKMAATYHSIISTVKMQGRSTWDYLGKFFVNIFNGCRDFYVACLFVFLIYFSYLCS